MEKGVEEETKEEGIGSDNRIMKKPSTRSPHVTKERIRMLTESEDHLFSSFARKFDDVAVGVQTELFPSVSEGFNSQWDSWSYNEGDPVTSSSAFDSDAVADSLCPKCGRTLVSDVCRNCPRNLTKTNTPRSLGRVGIPIFMPGEFKLFQKLGEGAFSQVYRGKCRGKDVAIKLLTGASSVDETSENQKFIQEVELLSRLAHPNIIPIMGACQTENNEFGIITEYMVRGDLARVLKKESNIPVWRKVQFAADIAEGMAWLSGKGVQILHRDLKPENVLVSDTWTCKVADFGLSRITLLKENIIDKGKGPGSVLWMAPEVLLRQPIDKKIDVYSFAIVFWQLFSLKRPYENILDYESFVDAIGRKRIRPPLDVVPLDFQTIIARSWAHSPEFRPDFQELITLIYNARVDHYLPQTTFPNGNQFWRKHFDRDVQIDLKTLIRHIASYLEVDCVSNTTAFCLKEILTPKRLGLLTVNIDRFSKMLQWFGDLDTLTPERGNLFQRIVTVMQEPWFFGEMGSADATRTLEPSIHLPGTYLVRLNPGGNESIQKSPFTISRVNGDQSITHIRIRHNSKGYSVRLLKKGESLRIATKKNSRIELVDLQDSV